MTKKTTEPRQISVACLVTPQVAEALDTLVATGLFGVDRPDVVSGLIRESVLRHADFALKRRRP